MNRRCRMITGALAFGFAAMAMSVAADEEPSAAGKPEVSDLDGRIQDAKSEVIQLNRDLLVLEEELLFPANTQVAVFVSA